MNPNILCSIVNLIIHIVIISTRLLCHACSYCLCYCWLRNPCWMLIVICVLPQPPLNMAWTG